MACAWQKDRANARGQVRNTAYFRDRDGGEKITDGTYPKKIAVERARTLLTQLDDPGFTNAKGSTAEEAGRSVCPRAGDGDGSGWTDALRTHLTAHIRTSRSCWTWARRLVTSRAAPGTPAPR